MPEERGTPKLRPQRPMSRLLLEKNIRYALLIDHSGSSVPKLKPDPLHNPTNMEFLKEAAALR